MAKLKRYETKLNGQMMPYLVEETASVKVDLRKRYDQPDIVADLMHFVMGDSAEERAYICALDAKLHLQGVAEVSHGTVSRSYISPREIFQKALMMGAAHIIMSHCHPTGDPTPSENDIESTKRVVEAGKIIGVDVVDHVIIGCGSWGRYCSLREYGVI